jgi:tetratricopeptide (TPR) repeat protein
MAKKVDATEDKIHAVEDALTRTEQFIEKNQKIITYVVGGIAALVLLIFAYNRFYMVPREKDAQDQIFMAQKFYEQDSLKLALNGKGSYPGFLSIIDDYGNTKAGNLARYYAGMCYLKTGKFQDAIDYLKKFSSSDEFVGPMAIGAIGDAHLELGQKEEAVTYYLKAADKKKNDLITPFFLQRAAFTYEELGKYDKAIDVYERIKKEHSKSIEARDIDKYIERAKGLSGK